MHGIFFRMALLSALFHVYIGVRLADGLTAHPGWRAALLAWLVFSALVIPIGVAARMFRPARLSEALGWLGLIPLGLFSSLFVLTLIRDASLLLLHVAVVMGLLQSLGQWSVDSAVLVPLVSLTTTVIGFINARRLARVVQIRVPLDHLPQALSGLRIVQISDIHVGPTIKRKYLQAIVDRVNSLTPDIIAITGDLVDGSVAQLSEHTAPLAQLRARHGSYFVTGNHEYYSGAAAWIAEVSRLGVRVLQNEHVVVWHDGAPLVIAGVNDYSAPQLLGVASDVVQSLTGAPQAPRVLLAHQPRHARAASAAGVDLQLSGHTHGGQFLPWNLLVPLQQPFVSGLHRLDRLWVYVSRGTGYWGPPKRFGAPSEITQLTLICAPEKA